MVDIAVIGSGMIGSATARYLAESGMSVTLIGPGPPTPDPDRVVYASHFDEARITRRLDKDVHWGELAHRSMKAYAELERRSGIRFHKPVGFLGIDLSPEESVARTARKNRVPHEVLTNQEMSARFPFLAPRPDAIKRWERAPAGYIAPLRMVEAQIQVASQFGCRYLRTVATSVRRSRSGFSIQLAQGGELRAAKVVVSTGAFTPFFRLLPDPVQLLVRPETVLLLRVPESVADAFRHMPSMVTDFAPGSPVPYAYILPPVVYPDGHSYIKIGADHDHDIILESLEEVGAYFRSNGSEKTASSLRAVMNDVIPGTRGWETTTKPCVLTYTPGGYPYIAEVGKDWFIATGGNGQGAKSSDAIGHLAAMLVAKGVWEDELDEALFAIS